MANTKMIETYLDGKLEADEHAEFQKKMRKNPSLMEEVQLHKEVNAAILDDDIEEFLYKIEEIIRTGKTKQKRIKNIIKYAAAAVIAVLLGLWFATYHPSPEALYADLYTPYQTDINKRSVENSKDKIEFAFLLYENGEYEASFEILENYLDQNYTNSSAKFFYGLCAMELEKYELAAYTLEEISADEHTPFSIHSKWYLALTYLKSNNPEKARQILNDLAGEKSIYQAKAKKALRKTRF